MKTQNPPEKNFHAWGSQAYTRRPSASVLSAAWIIDLSLGLALFFIAHRSIGRLIDASPLPSAGWFAGWLIASASIVAATKMLWGRTPGQAAWSVKATQAGWRAPLLSPTKIAGADAARAVSLTAGAIALSVLAAGEAVLRHPIWAPAEKVELKATLPDGLNSSQWEILPFYYTLGAWPRVYRGKPVLHSLPYEKGPPKLFPGHIVARWSDAEQPRTRVTYEGPKTPKAPSARPGERTPRERIRSCLTGDERSWDCLRVRESVLLRHLNEMNAVHAARWKVRWFEVRNPAIPPVEQAQGIWISAEGGSVTGSKTSVSIERYVLITENGTHQAISLEYPITDPMALSTFSEAIRSLRVSDDLSPGRAWSERKLADTKLQGQRDPKTGAPIPPANEAAAVAEIERLAQAQALLVSRISVEPAGFDAYFHLGGTSLMLQQSGLRAGAEYTGVSSVTRGLLDSTRKYARDLAPGDPRTTQLHGFWLDSKKAN
jgi:hypothetical protein